MSHTAVREQIGGSVELTISADSLLPAPTGPGCARFVVIDSTTAGNEVTLPETYRLPVGSRPLYVFALRSGSNSVDLREAGGSVIATMTAGNSYEAFLVTPDDAVGGWAIKSTSSSTFSTALARGRQPLQFEFDSALYDFSVNDWARAHGWDGTSVVSLNVLLGNACTIGSELGGSNPALSVEGFPSGSTLVLTVSAGAYVAGKGGAGGAGGNATGSLLPQNGSPGGLGLSIDLPTVVINQGTIAGGGGGGGGGSRIAPPTTGYRAGGGGGGGAGHSATGGGLGGAGAAITISSVTYQVPFGNTGNTGTLGVAGGGGAGGHDGGGGGQPGAAGDPAPTSGGLGGAAGNAVDTNGASWTVHAVSAGLIRGAVV